MPGGQGTNRGDLQLTAGGNCVRRLREVKRGCRGMCGGGSASLADDSAEINDFGKGIYIKKNIF